MKLLAAICASICVFFPITLHAQTIVLKSKTGNVRVDGTLVEFDGEYYRVKTDLGLLTIDNRTVNCSGEGCPAAQDMVSRFAISATGGLGQVLVPALLEAFSLSLGAEVTIENPTRDSQTLRIQDGDRNEIAKIDISVASEDVSYANLAQGGGVFVAVSRPPNQAEHAAIEDTGLGDLKNADQKQIMASNGIIMAVASTNPLKAISVSNLRNILLGDITNWRDVGGPDVAIDLYLAKNESGFDTILNKSLLGLKPSQITTSATLLNSLSDVSDAAASNPFGLGVTSFSNLRNANALGLKGVCGIYSVPSIFSIKSGDYPLTYNHFFFRTNQRLPLFAREFLDFAESDQAQNVIRANGYGDLAISSLSLNQQGLRLANAIAHTGKGMPGATLQEMVGLQNGANRLSSTFRFLSESKTLDVQSQQNISLLVSGLILGNYADKQVHIMGFTGSGGSSSRNIEEARKQAEIVLSALIADAPDGSLDDVDFHTSGFGEASPLACDDTEVGKNINRRVEIWIKSP